MRAHLSVRTYLMGLIAGVLLPPLVFGGLLVIRSAEREQDLMAMSARGRTHMAVQAVERELVSLRTALFLLAGGLSLQTSDLNAFHARAREAFGGMTVMLTTATGQAILDTRVPYGESLPDGFDQSAIRQVAETRQSRFGDLVLDPLTHRPVLTINVPVTRDSQLVYVLSLDIAETLPRILSQLDLPADWVAAVFDRRGSLIGRSRDADLFVGQLARPEFLQRIRSEEEGWFEGVSREGVALFSSFARTRTGGWTIGIGIPRDLLLAPVRRSTWNLILLGIVDLALAAGLAIVIGRRIAAPVIALVPVARSVGQGEPAALGLTTLREANMVARSLFEASTRLLRAGEARRIAIEALSLSERRYRVLANDLVRTGGERDALLERVVVAEENERKRIARELHDSLAQYLTALHLELEHLGQTRTDTARREAWAKLKALIDELGQEVNRMAWDLRPAGLDEAGLRGAIEHYLEEWSERAHLPVDVSITLGLCPLPAAVETTLLRVLQEAATNVSRHARASRVGVILEATDTEARLIVEDNGKGFSADAWDALPASARRLGLLGMRERLALVHGTLDVEAVPDHGTTLFVRVPLTRREAETP